MANKEREVGYPLPVTMALPSLATTKYMPTSSIYKANIAKQIRETNPEYTPPGYVIDVPTIPKPVSQELVSFKPTLPEQKPYTPSAQPTSAQSPPVDIDWNRVIELFKDPRATPAFYKAALELLIKGLSARNQAIAVQSQAFQRDITPYTTLYKTLGDIYTNTMSALYDPTKRMTDPQKAALAHQLGQIKHQMDWLAQYLFPGLGIPTEMQVGEAGLPQYKSVFRTFMK